MKNLLLFLIFAIIQVSISVFLVFLELLYEDIGTFMSIAFAGIITYYISEWLDFRGHLTGYFSKKEINK